MIGPRCILDTWTLQDGWFGCRQIPRDWQLHFFLGCSTQLTLGYLGPGLTTTHAYLAGIVAEPGPSAPRLIHALGPIENVIYVAAGAFGRIELVAIWLALKLASGWEGFKATDGQPAGKWDVFLIGNGLQVLIGLAGGLIVVFWATGQEFAAAATGLVPAMLVVLVWALLGAGPQQLWRAARSRRH